LLSGSRISVRYLFVNLKGRELGGCVGENSDHLGSIAFVQRDKFLSLDNVLQTGKHSCKVKDA
jgi:hypothetical protein